MALIKPKLGDDVLQTDKDQTNTLNGMDKLIEHGSNARGSWEKWESGKLVQTRKVSIKLNTSDPITFDTPVPFYDNEVYVDFSGLKNTPLSTTGNMLKAYVDLGITFHQDGKWMLRTATPSSIEDNIELMLTSIGRWKTGGG